MSCTTSFVPDPAYNTLSAICSAVSEGESATCATDPTCAAGYNDGSSPVVATCTAGSPTACDALSGEVACDTQGAPCRWDGSTCVTDLTLSGCTANICTASSAASPWRDTPGYVITDNCGRDEAGRTTAAINCDDTTCAPGYTGNPEVTCPITSEGLVFSGCTRDIQGGVFNESKKSVFHNEYDGTIDISWKHILGGLFFLFIFIAIMGFVNVKRL